MKLATRLRGDAMAEPGEAMLNGTGLKASGQYLGWSSVPIELSRFYIQIFRLRR